MSKKIKELMQHEFKAHFGGVGELLVVSLRGVGGNDNNALRRELLEKQIQLRVIKNSLAGRIFEQAGIDGMQEILTGPCALAYGGDSVVDVAKALMKWDKKLEHFVIKGGYLDGEVLSAEQAVELSKMPSRAELQGSIVMLAQSPGSAVASQIGSPAGAIAGCIKTLIEKLEAA